MRVCSWRKNSGAERKANKSNCYSGLYLLLPQIASVGLTEAEAQKAGYKINVGKFPFIGNGKAIALGEKEGLSKRYLIQVLVSCWVRI